MSERPDSINLQEVNAARLIPSQDHKEVICEACEEAEATCYCSDCVLSLCDGCADYIHKPIPFRSHSLILIESAIIKSQEAQIRQLTEELDRLKSATSGTISPSQLNPTTAPDPSYGHQHTSQNAPLQQLLEMGFDASEAQTALRITDGHVQQALQILMDTPPTASATVVPTVSNTTEILFSTTDKSNYITVLDDGKRVEYGKDCFKYGYGTGHVFGKNPLQSGSVYKWKVSVGGNLDGNSLSCLSFGVSVRNLFYEKAMTIRRWNSLINNGVIICVSNGGHSSTLHGTFSKWESNSTFEIEVNLITNRIRIKGHETDLSGDLVLVGDHLYYPWFQLCHPTQFLQLL
ncbi:hypothetical protein GEMRC1_001623 [Eukaryota sp. GEM-RC1]